MFVLMVFIKTKGNSFNENHVNTQLNELDNKRSS